MHRCLPISYILFSGLDIASATVADSFSLPLASLGVVVIVGGVFGMTDGKKGDEQQ